MRKLIAITLFLLAAAPAHAQRLPPVNLLRSGEPDAYTVQRQKEIEKEYNSALKKIPDRKKLSSDPWQNMRGSSDAKQPAPAAR